MAAISNDWLQPLNAEFQKPYYRKLFEKVKEEYNTRQVFPPADETLLFDTVIFPVMEPRAIPLAASQRAYSR